MKKINKSPEPAGLSGWRERNKKSHWNGFKKDKRAYQEVQARVKSDQGGLCAYCEIDLRAKTDGTLDDFRIEHFHPKSDDSSDHNWHLDWQNLLGCYHGGSQRNVVDASTRFSSPDHSCDVPKENKNLDNVILNPLYIPASPSLFKFKRSDGSIHVNEDTCQAAGIDINKAKVTIDELHLSTNRLNQLRRSKLNALVDQFRGLVEQGLTQEQARSRLARAHLKKNDDNNWPAFFSAIRDYLGQSSEAQLQKIEYNG